MDVKDPLDIGFLEASLCCRGLEGPFQLNWPAASWEHPETFWRGLVEAHRRLVMGRPKSVPFKHYDFYHDIVQRLEHNTAPAMQRPAGKDRLQSLSYAELGRRAHLLGTSWAAAGARKGQVAALILHTGELMAVALLAAFKLGIVVSILPPQGPSFLRMRLDALAPDFVVMEEIHTSLIPAYSGKVLPWEMKGTMSPPVDSAVTSSVYPSGSIAALLFDPCAPDPHVPHPMTADALYLGALRDGLLALGLRQGDLYAAPGFNVIETQPALLLAGLLNGATYLHLTREELEEHPEVPASVSLKVLGLSREVRDILLRRPVSLGKNCRHWFRHPGETLDMEPWTRCVQVLGLQESFASNLAWNASLGGCYLFSPRRLGTVHGHVLPAPGSPWRLGDVADASASAVGDWGVLMPSLPGCREGNEKEEKDVRAAPAIISKLGNVWFFARPPHSGKNGLYYPEEEVRAVVSTVLPGGLHCVPVTIPPHGVQDDPYRVLLVFTAACLRDDGSMSHDPARISLLARQAVIREMGPAFAPDRVELLPLFPRLDDKGMVDSLWCVDQYLTGRLQHKARSHIFRRLARLQAT